MIRAQGAIVQLRLELADSPAPAVALWELVGEQQRQAAMSLLAALIAQTVGGEVAGDELASLGGAACLEDGMTEGRLDGSGLQLVTVCLRDGPGVVDELGEPVMRADVVSHLRPSQARELAFELLELAELADRISEGVQG